MFLRRIGFYAGSGLLDGPGSFGLAVKQRMKISMDYLGTAERRTVREAGPYKINRVIDNLFERCSSLGFAIQIHFLFHRVQNEAVQAFALAGGVVFDDFPLAFLDNNIDSVVSLFIVPCGRFFLGVVVFLILHIITLVILPQLYAMCYNYSCINLVEMRIDIIE